MMKEDESREREDERRRTDTHWASGFFGVKTFLIQEGRPPTLSPSPLLPFCFSSVVQLVHTLPQQTPPHTNTPLYPPQVSPLRFSLLFHTLSYTHIHVYILPHPSAYTRA